MQNAVDPMKGEPDVVADVGGRIKAVAFDGFVQFFLNSAIRPSSSCSFFQVDEGEGVGSGVFWTFCASFPNYVTPTTQMHGNLGEYDAAHWWCERCKDMHWTSSLPQQRVHKRQSSDLHHLDRENGWACGPTARWTPVCMPTEARTANLSFLAVYVDE